MKIPTVKSTFHSENNNNNARTLYTLFIIITTITILERNENDKLKTNTNKLIKYILSTSFVFSSSPMVFSTLCFLTII